VEPELRDEALEGVVGRAVIDDHHLEPRVAQPEQRPDRLDDVLTPLYAGTRMEIGGARPDSRRREILQRARAAAHGKATTDRLC
jgi:hypothetical protein